MNIIFEMRAYGNENVFDRVGFIILDEDRDEPISNIYEDKRINVSCGSNWMLVEADEAAPFEKDVDVLKCSGYDQGIYYIGDWIDICYN